MAQGYYAAYVANATGAEFRARCGPSADGDRSEIQSVGYVPKARLTEMKKVQGSIAIDGSPRQYTFAAQRDPDEIEITLGWDDMDSLEILKALVASIRQSRSLAVEVPAFRARDTFTLNGAAQALGECK